MPLLQHFFLVAEDILCYHASLINWWESACESDGIESAWPAS